MPPLLSAPEVLNREFLEIRCKILELAAAFDRLERADGSVEEECHLIDGEHAGCHLSAFHCITMEA